MMRQINVTKINRSLSDVAEKIVNNAICSLTRWIHTWSVIKLLKNWLVEENFNFPSRNLIPSLIKLHELVQSLNSPRDNSKYNLHVSYGGKKYMIWYSLLGEFLDSLSLLLLVYESIRRINRREKMENVLGKVAEKWKEFSGVI